MTTYAQATARAQFLPICRQAIAGRERVYIEDKASRRYLTLDPEQRHITGPVIDISAQFFKDNFPRCSSLIRDGLCFRLSIRRSKATIIARRHTKYFDPCDALIERWRNEVVKDALTRQVTTDLVQAMRLMSVKHDSGLDEILQAVEKLKHGVARIAIGHNPFEEGELPNDA